MTTIFKALAELEENNNNAALCTIITSSGSTPRHAGSKILVYPDGHCIGTVGGGEMEQRVIEEALQSLGDEKPRLVRYDMVNPKEGDPGVCGGQLEVYVEPILGKPELIVVGGGHVGKALSHLAKWLGFRVIVSDDRVEYCTAVAHPDADAFLPVAMSQIPASRPFTRQTYVVLTTRGVTVDVEGLPAIMEASPAYIGVIGSKRRWTTTYKQLLEKGVDEELLRKVHSPIGLELNAETPEEIAVSIMAEIIMLRNQGTGKSMKMSA